MADGHYNALDWESRLDFVKFFANFSNFFFQRFTQNLHKVSVKIGLNFYSG